MLTKIGCRKKSIKILNWYSMKLNKFSQRVTQDESQPAAQAMLHAIGLTVDDFNKPLVGIASTGYEGNPCNCLLYTSPSPRDRQKSRMPSSA